MLLLEQAGSTNLRWILLELTFEQQLLCSQQMFHFLLSQQPACCLFHLEIYKHCPSTQLLQFVSLLTQSKALSINIATTLLSAVQRMHSYAHIGENNWLWSHLKILSEISLHSMYCVSSLLRLLIDSTSLKSSSIHNLCTHRYSNHSSTAATDAITH